jgi:hypothetical protein
VVKFLAGLLVAILCIGCAATTETGAKPRDANDAFLWLRTIDGFNSIDDEHIVVSSGSRHALVKTFGQCDGLRYAEQIGIEAPLGYLDKSGVGTIIYREFGGWKRRCPIDRIVAVANLKEARERVAAENAEKEKAKKEAR